MSKLTHAAATRIRRYFHAIESKKIVPEREWKFGYFGQHHGLLFHLMS